MRRLTHLIVLAAFVASLGGHWYLLQGIAWVKMVRDYSQVVPLREAVSMTLSGQYPCPICQAIAEKKNSGPEKIFAFEKYDKQVFPPSTSTLARPAPTGFDYPEASCFFPPRSESPPTPPPRPLLS